VKARHIALILLTGLGSCRDPYAPPAITLPNHFLVVDGFVNAANDTSWIILSRTANLADTEQHIPETGAIMTLESSNGIVIRTFLEKSNGNYMLPPTSLVANGQYRLSIQTTDGERFASDIVPVKSTPPIDSIFWRKDGDVTIYLATHDPSNSTRYYRWSYQEDWEYDSYFNSYLGYDINNHLLYSKTPDQMTTQCFRKAVSTDILVATTARQVEDRLDSVPLMVIPANSEKLTTRYSIEVTQSGMTEQAFEYWQQLQKNATQLGTIFDPLPSSVTGNLHDLTHPERPVLGLFSVTAPSKARIFIRNQQVAPWALPGQSTTCSSPTITVEDSAAYYLYDPKWQPAYYITNLTGGPRGLAVAPQECVDCRVRGGVTTKPAFW
jgi:hypothetical protein